MTAVVNPAASCLNNKLTSEIKSLPHVYIECLPTHGLLPLHARGSDYVLRQILELDAPAEGGDSQVCKCRLRTDAMVSVPVAEETCRDSEHPVAHFSASDSMVMRYLTKPGMSTCPGFTVFPCVLLHIGLPQRALGPRRPVA